MIKNSNYRNLKYPVIFCTVVFVICLILRIIEYFFIHTDQTILAENFIHKLLGILVLLAALKVLKNSLSDIGFVKTDIFKNIGKGLLLGFSFFLISYIVELLIVLTQSGNVQLQCYVSGFSLTGEQVKQTGFAFILLCIVFNVINVIMEEGIFRGMFIYTLNEKMSFMSANIVAALLFGVWHWVMPMRDYLYGNSTIGNLFVMGIGYIILSGMMSLKWGMLYKMSGSLWIGVGDHFFNNLVATNLLHVVSNGEADSLQIIRIMIAQTLSFGVVLFLYRRDKGQKWKIEKLLER